jgi:multidrug resistance efflux pump
VIPIFRDREDAYYVIEPVQSAVLHAAMPGRITAVYVKEGQTVQAGDLLVRAASLDASSATSESRAQLASSQQRLYQAELAHNNVGDALASAEGARRVNALAVEQRDRLSISAPFAGTVVSPSPESLVNQVTAAGEPLLTVADISRLKARVFLPEPEMARIQPGDELVFEVPASFRHLHATLGVIDGAATDLPPGVIESQQFAGTRLASFYSSVVLINPEAHSGEHDLLLGMSGKVKVFGVRRSVLSRTISLAGNLLRTHFW